MNPERRRKKPFMGILKALETVKEVSQSGIALIGWLKNKSKKTSRTLWLIIFPKIATNVCSSPCALLTLGHWHSPFQRWDLFFPLEPRCIFLTASISRMWWMWHCMTSKVKTEKEIQPLSGFLSLAQGTCLFGISPHALRKSRLHEEAVCRCLG